jgi:uncharacterized membrane protein
VGFDPRQRERNQRDDVDSQGLTNRPALPFEMRVTRNPARRAVRSTNETNPLSAKFARALWWVAVVATSLPACANATQDHLDERSTTQQPAASGAAGEGTGGRATDEAPPAWCAVTALLEAKCQRCHGAEPAYGAPFSLVSYEDTQVENRKGRPRFEAIEAALASDYMPPTFLELDPPVTPLTDDERSLLLAWCVSGAPGAADTECAADAP